MAPGLIVQLLAECLNEFFQVADVMLEEPPTLTSAEPSPLSLLAGFAARAPLSWGSLSGASIGLSQLKAPGWEPPAENASLIRVNEGGSECPATYTDQSRAALADHPVRSGAVKRVVFMPPWTVPWLHPRPPCHRTAIPEW